MFPTKILNFMQSSMKAFSKFRVVGKINVLYPGVFCVLVLCELEFIDRSLFIRCLSRIAVHRPVVPVSRFHASAYGKPDSNTVLLPSAAANERANQTRVLGSVDFAPDCSYRLPTREHSR